MALTREEKQKLDLFKMLKLDRLQTQAIIGRELTDAEWELVTPKDYKVIFKQIANEAAKKARKANYLKPANVEIKKQYGIPSNKQYTYLKDVFKKAADEAARKSKKYVKPIKPSVNFSDQKIIEKRMKRSIKETDTDSSYNIKSLFKPSNENYSIERINQYSNAKFKMERSEWKVKGTIDIFNTNSVISDLVKRMTENQPDNVKLQVCMVNSVNDKINQTSLLSKQEIIGKLSEWVNLFIDYHDAEIEDITFRLLSIEIPKGEGRVNTIITPESKRSIIQIKNTDSLCLARAIIVALARRHKEYIQEQLKGKLTPEEIAALDKGRQESNFTKINNGIIGENEVTNLVQGRKIQELMAQTLHRLCKIPIKEEGNDLGDAKLFEDKLDIQIHIFNLEAREIYKGTEKTKKIHILLSENHFEVISNPAAFLCFNASHHKKENLECNLCKDSTKCDTSVKTETCKVCNKYFYGESLLRESHKK